MKSIRNPKSWISIAGILLGNAILAFGIAGFILPLGMITGGATGIGIVLHHYVPQISISASVYIIYFAMFILGATVLGKKFALTTILSTCVYPTVLSVFTNSEWVSNLTTDPMLATLYAGILMGAGMGLVMRFGASTGGMDIPPLVLNKKFGIPIAVSLYAMDCGILLLQALFSNTQQVLYGIVIVLVCSIVLNYVVLAGQKKVQVMIVSKHFEQIKERLLQDLDLGATMFHIETGYMQREQKAVICVAHSRKVYALCEAVQEIDQKAFMTINQINEVRGRGFTLERKYKEKF